MSRPDKYGYPLVNLSEDAEAQIDSTGLTPAQITRERVIRTKYNIPINICGKVRATFKSKVWRTGKTMSKLGGTQRKLQLQKWRNEDSVWVFQINTRQTITKLVQQKRKAEEHLNDEMKKRIKLQSDVKQ